MRPPHARATVVLAALGALLAAAPAHAASRTDLRLSGLGSTTASAAPGGRVDAAVKVRGVGRTAARGALTLTLRTSPTSPKARTLLKRTTSSIPRGRTVRYAVTGTVPTSTPARDYVLVACVRIGSRKASCRTGRTVRVTALPRPVPAVPAPPATPAVPPATPAVPAAPLSDQLRAAITPERLRARLQALQSIADANQGTRASGTPGYDASVDYVVGQLRAAGYAPTVRPFTFDLFTDLGPTTFAQTAPAARTFAADEFAVMEYSGSGTVTDTAVTPVDVQLTAPYDPVTSGCEASDFASFPRGTIALLQRGTCDFGVKVANATAAGASAAILFNQGNAPDRVDVVAGTLGGRQSIPVVATSFATGRELAATGTRATVSTATKVETKTTANVIADTPTGDPKRTVVVGSHLDSVLAGPGINDNGSGSAFNLELAVRLAESGVQPANRMRFAWWGAEEEGLLGSTAYTDSLSEAELADIALDLNFDMLGSPNFARLIYDGDGSAFGTPGPAGSATIERTFERWFASRGQATAPTAFDGRSDYAGFIDRGIPAGGLFSGAEELKTSAETTLFGGIAGTAFDVNYHKAGDTLANVNFTGFEELADGAADVAAQFATGAATVPTPRVRPRAAGARTGSDRRGSLLVR